MKHFETKFASTDFKVNFFNLKKIKKIFKEKNRFLKKLIRNFNLPINASKNFESIFRTYFYFFCILSF